MVGGQMRTLEEIKRAIGELSHDELSRLREWFTEFDAELWDREIERDARSGRLDTLAREALTDLREGRCTDL